MGNDHCHTETSYINEDILGGGIVVVGVGAKGNIYHGLKKNISLFTYDKPSRITLSYGMRNQQ